MSLGQVEPCAVETMLTKGMIVQTFCRELLGESGDLTRWGQRLQGPDWVSGRTTGEQELTQPVAEVDPCALETLVT